MACRPNHIFRDTPDLEWPATRSGVGGLQSPDRAAGLPAICPLTLATHESTRPVAGLPGSPYHPSPSPVLPDPFLRSVTSLRHVPPSRPSVVSCRGLVPRFGPAVPCALARPPGQARRARPSHAPRGDGAASSADGVSKRGVASRVGIFSWSCGRRRLVGASQPEH